LAPALLSAGGGPAGVVEFARLNKTPGFDVAGVVDPVGAEEDDVAGPNDDGVWVVLAPTISPPDCACDGVSAPLVAGVELSLFSSVFFPNVNPVLPPKILDVPVVLPAPPNSPPV
jgi:hypothetical protein